MTRTRTEHLLTGAALAALLGCGAYLIATHGPGHLAWMVSLGATAIVGVKIGRALLDYAARDRRYWEIMTVVARVATSTGLRITVEPIGTRFSVVAVAETAPDRGMVSMMANASPYGDVCAWLAGLESGHRLAEYAAEQADR